MIRQSTPVHRVNSATITCDFLRDMFLFPHGERADARIRHAGPRRAAHRDPCRSRSRGPTAADGSGLAGPVHDPSARDLRADRVVGIRLAEPRVRVRRRRDRHADRARLAAGSRRRTSARSAGSSRRPRCAARSRSSACSAASPAKTRCASRWRRRSSSASRVTRTSSSCSARARATAPASSRRRSATRSRTTS